MYQSDTLEFYPKSIIPIGMKDKQALKIIHEGTVHLLEATHWLITLKENINPIQNQDQQWQVCLVPTDLEGRYTWSQPFFASTCFDSIEQAIDISCELEMYGQDDAIFSSNIRERMGAAS
ncbi:hypothetical protein ACFSO7_04850 [Bacillus sp. CGMCC 1.16607]|uniref:hypothetical protein n=1 Tax=Bacillus sp. CGMCC 1.16607 TaxID=3351842 RepID=UPI0036292174